jgi:hypothetical protein
LRWREGTEGNTCDFALLRMSQPKDSDDHEFQCMHCMSGNEKTLGVSKFRTWHSKPKESLINRRLLSQLDSSCQFHGDSQLVRNDLSRRIIQLS